jgi:glycosyltransferase involved in cell wall biosynthesis
MSDSVKQPFFSILIPSYNRPEDIGRNVESILADPFKDVEIIISDDNSPLQAEVRAAVERYLTCDNIHYFEQPKNLREPNNKNFLVEKASGQYSIIIGDDDRFFTGALTDLKAYIDAYPDFEMYCFGYNIVDEHDRTVISRQSPKLLEISDGKPDWIKAMFCADMLPLWLFHPNTFCCKNGVEKDLRYQTDVGIGEDLYFIFDFLSRGKKMLVLPQMMFHWRKIQDVSNTKKQINQSLAVLSDFTARKLMYDKLQRNVEIAVPLRDFLQTREYRVRFLYNSIVSDPRVGVECYTREAMKDLPLSNAMLNEFLDYALSLRMEKIRRKLLGKRIVTYIRLLGFSGLSNIAKSVIQRIAYQLHQRGFNDKASMGKPL